MIRRIYLPAAFAALVAALVALKPPACVALYAGAAVYLAFAPAGALVRWRLDRRFPLAFAVYLLSLVAAGAVAAAVPPIRADYVKLGEAQARFFAEATTCPMGWALVFLQALVLAPLVEEMLFRGIVFEEVKGRLGPAAAYVVSSLVFAILHKPGLAAVPIFIVALALAFAYDRYGLPASILLHFLQNAAALWLTKGG
ncbi:CPBP family intramembrane glutamic endopeptidase [Pyrobaculum neutrophilum]|uniref:CPBP family intramembrane glutamic endopeptidase n=1 Tax=Pyrobaculum neutrophilum TaxID=70771 RepID=UPI001FE07315|nr:CPBP family intramembrane glutamic endopeptidase [Pyrobaculum neutrophilum]